MSQPQAAVAADDRPARLEAFLTKADALLQLAHKLADLDRAAGAAADPLLDVSLTATVVGVEVPVPYHVLGDTPVGDLVAIARRQLVEEIDDAVIACGKALEPLAAVAVDAIIARDRDFMEERHAPG